MLPHVCYHTWDWGLCGDYKHTPRPPPWLYVCSQHLLKCILMSFFGSLSHPFSFKLRIMRKNYQCHFSLSFSLSLSLFGIHLFPPRPQKIPVQPSSKTSEQRAAVSCHTARCSCQNLALCRCNLQCVWFGAHFFWNPFVPLQWARRLTEPQQSQDAAWDIDRLEPEGSCRIGTHCQRLGYHHCLPALEGGRGVRSREG